MVVAKACAEAHSTARVGRGQGCQQASSVSRVAAAAPLHLVAARMAWSWVAVTWAHPILAHTRARTDRMAPARVASQTSVTGKSSAHPRARRQSRLSTGIGPPGA